MDSLTSFSALSNCALLKEYIVLSVFKFLSAFAISSSTTARYLICTPNSLCKFLFSSPVEVSIFCFSSFILVNVLFLDSLKVLVKTFNWADSCKTSFCLSEEDITPSIFFFATSSICRICLSFSTSDAAVLPAKIFVNIFLKRVTIILFDK